MAPIKQNIKGKHFKSNFARGGPSHNAKGKRKWIPENKFFDGSLNEGQGFAFKRKEKIKHDYNKLLRKERRRMQQSRDPLKEEYPEHLKHLYLAEKERLEEEEQEKKKMRWKGRAVDDDEEEQEHTSEKHTSNTTADQTHSSNEAEVTTQSESSHKAPHIPRKHKKMSSYQKTKQEYERMKEEQERRREKFLKDKAQREEALKKYKEKKMATYQLLKKKTKKGQPNLNLHMELLLQKIEAQRK